MAADQDELAAIVARIFEATYSPAIHRGLARHDARMEPDDQRHDDTWIESVVPFLDRALATSPDPESNDDPLVDAARALPIAICVVDGNLGLRRATPRAYRLLNGASLLSLDAGRITTETSARGTELSDAIASVVGSGTTQSIAWAGPDGVAQEFLCAPLPNGTDEPSAMIVMNVEIGAFDRFCETLERNHGLTPSEAEVAAHLAQGRSIDEIAAAKGTSTHTVRTQVKQAFAKTGTSRQGELIALVLNGSAAWLRLLDDPPEGSRSPVARPGSGRDGLLELEDGRSLGYGDYGPASGRPVVVCHHLLGSRADAPRDLELLDRLDVRLLVPERPGVGRSTPVDKRSLMACAADVGQLVDALGIERFHVFGASSGGAHAAACAALLPDRVLGLGLAASMMPWDELPAGTPIDLTQRFLVAMARRWPSGVRRLLVRRYRAQLDRPDAALAELLSRGNAADVRLFETPDVSSRRLRDLRAAARVPPEVFADELVSLFRPWGFALCDLAMPVHVWHGRQDDFFSFDQASAIAPRLAEGHATFREDWGHFFFYDEWDRILGDLVAPSADA